MIQTPATRKQLTLYLPGILSALKNGDFTVDSLHGLETLLSRAEKCMNVASSGYEDGLFALFGLQKKDNSDLPVAAVTRMLDMGVIDNDWWLRADPVYLNLEHDRLILADAETLEVTREEANRLVAEIMDVFTADGWLLKAPRPDRWYLKLASAPNITTTALSQVIGQDVHAFLPHGPDGKTWHTTLNEIQILLHTTTVNSERERAGKLPINSLWFWGGGQLPRMAPVNWTKVWSNEPVSLSLARLTDTPGDETPDGFDDWFGRAGKPGDHLVVLDEARRPMLYHDVTRWNDVLRQLEQKWMAPLLKALQSGAISGARLITDDGTGFSLSPRQARRWWRIRRPLSVYGERRN
jgi:hypothetical protein